MQDKEVLKYLQHILDEMEVVAKRYRSDRNVSKALKNVYSSVAIAGGAIIQKMTEDEERAAEAIRQAEKQRIIEERRERRDAKKSK
jgi:hypothetical protein